MQIINQKTIERLCVYRRLLRKMTKEKINYFYSHDLATMAHVTSVQVRRDLMYLGYSGSNRKGYETEMMLRCIDGIIDPNEGMKICIVGMGNLGKALVNFFADKSDKLHISALFDIDKNIVNYKYNGIYCHHSDRLAEVVKSEDIKIGIISSSSSSAKQIAETMKNAGIISIINFTTTPLNLPDNMFLEEVDITTSIEKASYFAKTLSEIGNKNSKKKTVFIIDDDIDIINSYTAILKNSGFKVDSSQSAQKSLSVIKKRNPDLIILDIMMEKPDSGFLLLNELKENYIDIPVILSSSIAKATANILDVSQLKIKTILQKPVDIDLLVENVKKYI